MTVFHSPENWSHRMVMAALGRWPVPSMSWAPVWTSGGASESLSTSHSGQVRNSFWVPYFLMPAAGFGPRGQSSVSVASFQRRETTWRYQSAFHGVLGGRFTVRYPRMAEGALHCRREWGEVQELSTFPCLRCRWEEVEYPDGREH